MVPPVVLAYITGLSSEHGVITRLKLKPGQKGTKALVEKYGDALVCVRYRYDEASRTRIKTVELVVEKKELGPVRVHGSLYNSSEISKVSPESVQEKDRNDN